jgi:hypothetical protein
LATHDPFTLLASWAVRYRGVIGWVATLAFVAFVFFPDTRWTAVVTLWAILGAGLLVSLILTEHAEPIQRRAWLGRNVTMVESVADTLIQLCWVILALGVGLPNDVSLALRTTTTIPERRTATRRAREVTDAYIGDPKPASEMGRLDFDSWMEVVIGTRKTILELVADYPSVMTRCVQLQTAVNSLAFTTDLSGSDSDTPPSEEYVRVVEPIARGQIALRALEVCERCIDVLEEAGAFNPRTKKGPTHIE